MDGIFSKDGRSLSKVYERSSSKRHQFNVVDVFISSAGELHESGDEAKSRSITHTLFFCYPARNIPATLSCFTS